MEESMLSPWVRIPLGIVLFFINLLCLLGVIVMPMAVHEEKYLFGVLITTVCAILNAWLFIKCFQLIFNLNASNGLISPFGFRVAAVMYMLLPIVGIFTGYYSQYGWLALIQAGIYYFIGISLLSYAKQREGTLASYKAL
ncbi:hypothetical protein [Pseudoalteromonas rubra]|uniref:hypothetical protein n=1 Tax=Pseudoalteromonas rubra TaxID=43658 RepID=UPI000F78CE43|nr:hypothetical protein [Pseudoalteromonas rubra]